MYAIERTRIIKQYLEENGQAHVHQLSGLLGVSEVTVRRDLERLEVQGWLTRTHGGAVLTPDDTGDPLSELVEPPPDEGAEEIASVAVRMVNDGDVVMITDGRTGTVIAKRLEARCGLTVLTNDVTIALRVANHENGNRVVLLGGDVTPGGRAVFGSMALGNLQRFFVRKLFVEVDGVNDELQVSVDSQEKADLILGAIEAAQETILICSAERFSRNAFYRLGDIQLADRVVTSSAVPESFKTSLFARDIPLYASVAAFEGSA